MLMLLACIGETLISIFMFRYNNHTMGIIWGAFAVMHFLLVAEKLIKKIKEKKHEAP